MERLDCKGLGGVEWALREEGGSPILAGSLAPYHPSSSEFQIDSGMTVKFNSRSTKI
jgi:hypothetical protein